MYGICLLNVRIFLRLKLGRLPAYQRLLAIGKERKGAIFLDIGCCCQFQMFYTCLLRCMKC